jgi:hypothetical protein
MRNRYFPFGGMIVLAALMILVAFSEIGADTLPNSLAYASCFLLTIYFLRKRITSLFEIILTAASATFSGLWLYEVMYHYLWGTSLGTLKYDFSNLSIVVYPGWPFPIYFAVAMIFFPFLKREYISLNKPLVAMFSLSLAVFTLLPLFAHAQYNSANDPTTAIIAYWMNSITKIVVVVPAFLFCHIGRINLSRKSKMGRQISLVEKNPEIALD